MKHYNPKRMKPNLDQFLNAVKDKISESGQRSLAYKAVKALFEQAETLYKTLDFMTSENAAQFTSTGKYLTQRQESDAVALTAMYVGLLKNQLLYELIQQDSALNEQERQVLGMVVEIYKAACEANYATLGNPRWVDE